MQQKSKLKQLLPNEYLLPQHENWENWRLKSLNSGNLQRYSLPFSIKTSGSKEQDPSIKHIPKITKINEYVFCILLNNIMNLFYYIDQNEREKRKIKSRFIKLTIENIVMPVDIESLFGDGKECIYLASGREVAVIRVKGAGGKGIEEVTQIFRKKINNVKGLKVMESNLRKILLILTNESVYMHEINKNYEMIREFPITFSSESSGWSDISKINGISIVIESPNVFYFVGTSVELKADVRFKLSREAETKNQPIQKKCQALYLTKFQLISNRAEARVFIIDHIFQIGIFKKSRVHQVGKETFLISLYEQIIVVRRNFSKFMVWDNVSILSSKSNEKKGQLVLADKRIMVYTESGQISAYELFFNFQKAKLQTPKIDSFKGNGNEQQILYDALILEYKSQTYMKVLFYFKEMQIYIPNRKVMANNQQSGGYTAVKNQLFFQIMCIEQTEPTEKLKELLQKNKSQNQIESFLKRFNIKQLKYKKSEWQVSAKGEKQIEAFLLNIKDNQYIQSQLTKILKAKPHDLAFLIAIEKKQIQRYRNMIASKILLFQEHQENFKKTKEKEQNIFLNKLSQFFLMRQLDQVKLAVQWLLQSKMFYQKLLYSMNFMTFKEYDFIQIGKLRTASLRQEIKLLGVKGYEKRLKYFLNSFKYLVLDDFKEILRFVIMDLNQSELKTFFSRNFPFILPSYNPNSNQDRCRLWENNFNEDECHIETISSFRKEVQEQIAKLAELVPQMFHRIPMPKAIEAFNELFNQFMASPWFIENSYKQHSLLHHSIEELKSVFEELKEVGVFNTIVELAYEKVQKNHFSQSKVKEMIGGLRKENYLTQEYIFNIEARLQVYELMLLKIKIDKKRYMGLALPKKSEFIIIKESQLFGFLFDNFAEHLTNIIRQIYETKQKGLFLKNFKKYLYSPLPQLESLIHFMGYFKDNEHSEVSKQIFNCICQMMPITDEKNSLDLINTIKDMPVPHRKDNEKFQEHLLDSAKVSYGNYFSPIYNKFQLRYTYSQLIAQTQCKRLQETKIMCQILSKFITKFDPHLQNTVQFKKSPLLDQQISNIELGEVIDFLSVMLYMHKMLDYQFEGVEVFTAVLVGFFGQKRFDVVGELMEEIMEFGKVFDDRALIEKYGNYRVFNDFKMEINLKKELENTGLKWVDEKYQSLINLKSNQGLTEQTIRNSFVSISAVLKILNFYSTSQQIQENISRITLLSTIKQISPPILLILMPGLIGEKQKYSKISGFIFMMNLLDKIAAGDSKDMFKIKRREEILQLLSGLGRIHKQFVNAFHEEKKSQDVLLGEVCRFNAELVVELMRWGFPRVAGFVLLDLINSSYHYRDALFYYVARMADNSKVSQQVVQKLIYEFMTVDGPQDLKKILNNYIVQHQLAEIVPAQLIPQNVIFIFKQILKNNQLDEAFYFGLRNTEVEVQELQKIVLATNKFREDHVIAQSMLITFIRTVKHNVAGQIWPSFMLYKRKINCLMRPTERMDVIKDVVIMMKQLQIEQLRRRLKQPETKGPCSFQKLKNQYEKYMRVQNLNPLLTINTEEIEPSAIRLEKYPEYSIDEIKSKQEYYKLLPITRQEQSNEVKQLRKKLFDNEQKLKQIQESNRQLLEEQIVPAITQVKINAQREHLSLLERKKKKKEEEEQAVKEKAQTQQKDQIHSDLQQGQKEDIQKLNEQQKQKINQVKKSYSSKIVQETEKLISQLRERRKKVKQQTAVTFATEEQRKKTEQNLYKSSKSGSRDQRNSFAGADMINSMAVFNSKANPSQVHNSQQSPSKDKKSKIQESGGRRSIIAARDQLKQKLEFLRESHLKGTTINRLMADKNGQFYVPRWEQRNPMSTQFEQMLQDKPKKSQFVEKVKKQMVEQAEKQKKQKAQRENVKKLTLPELIQKYKLLGEPAASQMIQKIPVVATNLKAGTQLIKNIYIQMKEIKNFIELCHDLLMLNELTRQFIEQKAIKIVEEALKTKVAMGYKQIFPAHFFTSIHSMSVRQYYSVAYGMIQPNMIKQMSQPGCNVNALAIMIRFGFGSDSTYYYRVYEDYIRALLDSYASKSQFVFVEKDLMQLAEKLRSNYNNLNPTNKKAIFENLIREIQSPEKRKALIKASLVNLQNKSSMVNKETYEEFRIILVKLQDNTP